MERVLNLLSEWLVLYGMKTLIGIAILLVGWFFINISGNWIRKAFRKKEMDETLIHFLMPMYKITLWILLIITVAGMVGIQTTSFIAVIGAASLAIGFALQGTLQNFAGGVIILTVKPFITGDFISVQEESGTVEKITIFYTYLKTPDNKVVMLPNGSISNSVLTNFTREKIRRVDLNIGIAYGDDIKLARQVILDIIKDEANILSDPKPELFLKELGDNAIVLSIRCWTAVENYWPVFFQMQEKIYEVFPERGLNFPFPQLDVHMVGDED